MPESLLDRIKKTTRLPSPPGTALQILRLCQQEDVELSELAETLAADPALSLRLLKYANSPLVGASNEITSVREAVVLLGIRCVRLMALSFSLVSTDDARVCRGFNYGQFWSHSVACAVAARFLAKQDRKAAAEEAFAAGLLTHIGKLVFAVCIPGDYARVLDKCDKLIGETTEYEQEAMGSNHEDLGADLLLEWGIPKKLAEGIRGQNHYEQLPEDSPVRPLARIMQAASAIADVLCETVRPETLEARWATILKVCGLKDRDAADQIVEAIRREFSELASVLSLKDTATLNAKEIQAEAGEVLGELSLAAQLKSEAVEKENLGLQEQAFTDALTGINNRAAFDRRLAESWNRAIREHRALGLIMLDVDHFKKFNDTYGHQTGDEVLKAVGACLRKAVRAVDFPARYGGEEFAVIAANVDRLTAAQICVKIRTAIESAVVVFEGRKHKVTVSVGAAVLPVPGPPFNPKMLIEAADKQLYQSKQKGRNCCSMRQLQAPGTGASKPQPVSA